MPLERLLLEGRLLLAVEVKAENLPCRVLARLTLLRRLVRVRRREEVA